MKITAILPVLAAWATAMTFTFPPHAAESTANSAGQLSRSDYEFACKAARGSLYEIKAGLLAREKAVDPRVKQFGERMVNDHGKASEELKQIAVKKGAILPLDLDKAQQKRLDHLEHLVGKDFEKTYLHDMLDDHRKDLKEFHEQAVSVQDPNLQKFASTTAMVIEEHLREVKELNKN